jgi:methylthioribose-1-phosphate isomerase
MIDQTKLPTALEYIECRDPETVFAAIRRLSVRGAPAIGIAAAMGLVLGIRDFGVRPGVGDEGGGGHEGFVKVVNRVSDYLASSRPTAVNLFWALERMKRCALKHMAQSIDKIKQAMLDEALAIRDEDARMCHAIGRHGAALIPEGGSVITHCNAGSLATAEYGTALAPMYASHAEGKSFTVYVDETRPLLQGARLTAWELMRAGIQIALICDNAAAHVMKRKGVDVVITGADRIAANGDAANKIGTYGLAVLAQAHGVPFYIAAPSSTFDLDACDGDSIPIEERDPDEIRRGFGVLTAPVDAPCYCPAFDVTPASLIAGIITEKGLISPVTGDSICETLGS